VVVARCRARDLGIRIGNLDTGPNNAITDVVGVQVGHCTVSHGDGTEPAGSGPSRTGVTAIWPHREDIVRHPVAAGFFSLSGTGEMTGRSEIEELGRICTPIVLTNTMGVGIGYEGACRYLMDHDIAVGDDDPGFVIPVVAECDDSFLHDVRGAHLTVNHVAAALDAASSGPVPEGAVGSGTGMHSFRFKGGIGTSSRVLSAEFGGWTVGVLTMTNFGARHRLTIDGIPAGRWFPLTEEVDPTRDEGSGIVVVATDAPLDARQLNRVAKRASLGLARTGSIGANGSGELLLAFSTTFRPQSAQRVSTHEVIDGYWIDPIFEAAIDATEESVLNALFMATTTSGRKGRSRQAIPLDRVREILDASAYDSRP
jgi:D-aminopeptidase